MITFNLHKELIGAQFLDSFLFEFNFGRSGLLSDLRAIGQKVKAQVLALLIAGTRMTFQQDDASAIQNGGWVGHNYRAGKSDFRCWLSDVGYWVSWGVK